MSAATTAQSTIVQVLTVLNTLRALYASGMSLDAALRAAIERTRREFGVPYQSVREACTKNLGLDPDDFVELAQRWLQGDSTALFDILKRRTKDVKVHRMVQQVIDLQPVSTGLGLLGLAITATEDKPGTAAFTFRVGKSQAEHLRAIAKREGHDVAKLLEQIVTEYIHHKTQEELTEQFNSLSPREQQELLRALQAEVERKEMVRAATTKAKPAAKKKPATRKPAQKPAAKKPAPTKPKAPARKPAAKKKARR